MKSLHILSGLAAMGLAAQLSAGSADLGVAKRLVTPAGGVFPAKFEVAVTNYGPDPATSFTLTDTLPANVGFDSDFSAQAPWICTLGGGTTASSVTCTYPVGLGVGQTVTLPILVATAQPGRYDNCVTVALGGPDSDPDATNNRDCACVDFRLCRQISIDLSTGVRGTQTLGLGANDDDWVVVSTPAGPSTNTPAKVVGPYHTGFVKALPAEWIASSNPQPESTGDYVFEIKYATGPERFTDCAMSLDYASDNGVTFTVDGVPWAQNLATDHTAFTQLHHRTWYVPSGTHTVRARVKNDGGPTSLLVKGTVFCACYYFIDLIPVQR